MVFGSGNITSFWIVDPKTRMTLKTHNRQQQAANQTPTSCIKANPTFTSIEINETCGDCDVGAYISISSFCSLMWIARGRTARALRFASASTNTASTPVARTLRICACDRSLGPRAQKSTSQKGETQMTNHYVATVPVKYTDGEDQERTRFQRVGAMFRNTRGADGLEFFSLKLDFPVSVQELVMFPPSSKEPQE